MTAIRETGKGPTGPPPPTPIRNCRACGNTELIDVVDLGVQYPSLIFPRGPGYRAEIDPRPLGLVLCAEREGSCGLVQLGHRHDLSALYDDYPYASAANASMAGILADVARSGRAVAGLEPGDVVLDIGGNDGTLLGAFADDDTDLVVVDPASGVEPAFESERLTRVDEFFSAAAYRSACDRPAKLAFSVAMFFNLDAPLDFAREIASVLADDGVLVVQMTYLPSMLDSNMYDNVVHENPGYYGVRQIGWIMERAGLELFDVTFNDVYGGSFRVFAAPAGRRQPSARVAAALAAEQRDGLHEPVTYERFQRRIESARDDLLERFASMAARAESAWVYGASTKGNTILQFCGLGRERLEGAADANPTKVGRLMIGSDVPIRDEDAMRAAAPDWLLALPYTFVEAFAEREAELVARGTRFLAPLPEVRALP